MTWKETNIYHSHYNDVQSRKWKPAEARYQEDPQVLVEQIYGREENLHPPYDSENHSDYLGIDAGPLLQTDRRSDS